MEEKLKKYGVGFMVLVGLLALGWATGDCAGTGNRRPRGEVKADPTAAAIYELEHTLATATTPCTR